MTDVDILGADSSKELVLDREQIRSLIDSLSARFRMAGEDESDLMAPEGVTVSGLGMPATANIAILSPVTLQDERGKHGYMFSRYWRFE